MAEPSDDARAILDAFRQRTSPPPDVHARSWGVLRGRLFGPAAADDRGVDIDEVVEPPRRRSALGVAVLVAGLAAAVIVAAGIGWSQRHSATARPLGTLGATAYTTTTAMKEEVARAAASTTRGERAAARDAVERGAVEHDAVEHDASEREPIEHDAVEREDAAVGPAKTSSRRPARVPAGIDAEVALLKRAEATRALHERLRLLRKHAREFPNGAFADVRSVRMAETLCALGQAHEARVLVERFLDEHPGSAFAERARRVCARRAAP